MVTIPPPRPLATFVLALALATAGCGVRSDAPLPQVGLSNPASMHCASRGGRVSIRNTAAGQEGWCTLPDGRAAEEWALYRADQGTDP